MTRTSVSFSVALALAVGGAALPARAADPPPQILTPAPAVYEAVTRFTHVLQAFHESYIAPERVGAPGQITGSLRAFVRGIDPEADLLSPDEAAAFPAPAAEAVAGEIGLTLSGREGRTLVVAPRDGGPAQPAGLLAGDFLLAVDGRPTLNARLAEVESALRGPAGSNVVLRVFNPEGRESREVTLARQAPAPARLDGPRDLGSGGWYCRLPAITPPVVEALRATLARPEAQQARGLVLDLRHTATGDFEAAVVAANLFLPAKAEVVRVRYPRRDTPAVFVSDGSPKFRSPVVLLVNAGTAGPAELFAVALQAFGRARLVGTRTFGLGRLFQSVPLPEGGALYLPVAEYLAATGASWHGTGLSPDVAVLTDRDQERRLATAGFGHPSAGQAQNTLLEADPVLARAVRLLSREK